MKQRIRPVVAQYADGGGCGCGEQLEETGILCILMVVVVWICFQNPLGGTPTLVSYGMLVVL